MEGTPQELSDYITRFSEIERESVLKAILESELLQKFLSTTDGRLVLGGMVDLIRDKTMNIVNLSASGFSGNEDEIEQAALEINIAFKFMHQIAGMVVKGDEHTKKMKK